MKMRDVLARNLRRIRKEKRISQEDLAHRAQIDRTYISSLERSRYGASIDVLERIAAVLEVEVVDLLIKEPEEAGS